MKVTLERGIDISDLVTNPDDYKDLLILVKYHPVTRNGDIKPQEKTAKGKVSTVFYDDFGYNRISMFDRCLGFDVHRKVPLLKEDGNPPNIISVYEIKT